MLRHRSRARGRGLSTGFSPASVPGLVLWADSLNIGGILDLNGAQVADGTLVKTERDVSSKSHDLTQATALNRPAYRATSGGLPSIEYFASGGLELLTTVDHPDFNYTTMAMYSVLQWKTSGGTQTFFSKYQPTGNQREIQLQINGTPAFVAITSPDGTSAGLTTCTASDAITTGVKYVLSCRWNGTTLTVKVNNNIGTLGSATPAAIFPGTADVAVGALPNGSQGFKGYAYENLFYNINPSDAQDTAIITSLMKKWAIP